MKLTHRQTLPEDDSVEIPNTARTIVALEALRNQLHNLEETIRRLLELMNQMPEGNLWDRLFHEISCLDSIADVMRQALDSTNAGGRSICNDFDWLNLKSSKLLCQYGSALKSKKNSSNQEQIAAFLPEFPRMKNDRGKIAAKGANCAGFQGISLEFICFARSDPVANLLFLHT